jgi:Domain of unknown function (4846)
MTIILPLLTLFQLVKYENEAAAARSEILTSTPEKQVAPTIKDIQTPPGFTRTLAKDKSFAAWLREIQLKKDGRVFLYNGNLKGNQLAQFAVLDIPIGSKDLQQCADAVMRLRSQFLYDNKRYNEISFADNSGKRYQYSISSGEPFDRYLEKVYSYCGTISLAKQLNKRSFHDMQIGDVLIRGGSPGHAVLVVDMAVRRDGKKIYLLAQSYMPAQNIHILKNPRDKVLSPWYEVNDKELIYTPEWVFSIKELKSW